MKVLPRLIQPLQIIYFYRSDNFITLNSIPPETCSFIISAFTSRSVSIQVLLLWFYTAVMIKVMMWWDFVVIKEFWLRFGMREVGGLCFMIEFSWWWVRCEGSSFHLTSQRWVQPFSEVHPMTLFFNFQSTEWAVQLVFADFILPPGKNS